MILITAEESYFLEEIEERFHPSGKEEWMAVFEKLLLAAREKEFLRIINHCKKLLEKGILVPNRT